MPEPMWHILSIKENPKVADFNCGVLPLNDFLRKCAGQNERKNIGITFVLVPSDGSMVAMGYYTLCMAQVEFQVLSEKQRKGLPRHPIPVVRLARLAVELSMQGKGLGELLLIDALHRSVRAAQVIAAKYIVVDAKNPKAEGFYRRYGFEPFESRTQSLVASIQTIAQAFK